MLVRLWAGPSCIARAISRRRSSWASRSRRDDGRRHRPRRRRRRRPRRRRRAPAPSPTGAPSALDVARRARRGSGPSARRLPSRTSTWDSISAARLVSVTSWALSSATSAGRVAGGSRQRRSSFSAAAARRVSWRAASVRAWATSRSTSPSSRVEARELVGQPRGELGQRWRAARSRRRSSSARSPVGVVVDQSSGIRIQPWRIAYTTAWVRSLTDSLRRIELMWFLTVCSLIDSA